MGKVLYFTASWCGPCKQTRPIVEEVNKDNEVFQIIDVDTNPAMVSLYSIKSVPTFVGINSEGSEVFIEVGAQTENNIKEMVSRVS